MVWLICHQSSLLRWQSPPGSSSWCSLESGSWYHPCASPLPAEVIEVVLIYLWTELNVVTVWRHVKVPPSAGVLSPIQMSAAGLPDAGHWMPVWQDADSWLTADLWGAPTVPSSPALLLPAPVFSDALLLTGLACHTPHGTTDPARRGHEITERASTWFTA